MHGQLKMTHNLQSFVFKYSLPDHNNVVQAAKLRFKFSLLVTISTGFRSNMDYLPGRQFKPGCSLDGAMVIYFDSVKFSHAMHASYTPELVGCL